MTGEQNFIAHLNIEWFRRHNNRSEVTEKEAFAGLLSFATFNCVSHMAPCWKVEHELRERVQHFADSMGWTEEQKRYAYKLAHDKLVNEGLKAKIISSPC